ncbi:Dolichyl-phosphate-mannose-protein mannosyltransferase [Tritrichomonas foetus]|uniref:Dolichyl-phosphate-mannose-protein mannosyltransferase n=1 Tax=Tritrichomonas foetus TaxID=1144522 RepID=A0A1J4L270_9EUKA|nr:Dolichyl-phosphate-mannose-protein mannosyltransferase [Tritrichomonas foetus]|eukprot:OHT15989.1 Dolichyl-phosphate-mannose-protein mannosyltransferase [Tritrichomonas foetus]
MKNLFTTSDSFAIVILSFVALFTRLWLIADPDQITFDEVHFGNFTNWYIKKEFFFDIHPPLGKMIMAAIADLTQYKGDIDYGSKFGQSYHHNELFFVSQRITPAIFSAMTSPLIYAACRCLSFSTLSSFCAGIILTSDISLIVEGKFILSDGVLHFFVALHIFTLCLFLSKSTLFRTLICGFTLGCAAACKYTALGLYAIDGMSQLVWIFVSVPKLSQVIKRALLLLIPSFVAFLGAWIWHFIILYYTGHNSEYLYPEYSATIFSKEKEPFYYWGDRLIGSSLLERIANWNVVMNNINMRSDIPHPFESQPIYWPLLMDKWIGFLSIAGSRNIECMGTPFVYWFVFLGLVLTIFALPFRKADWRNLLFCWGWMVSYFPFILVPRTMFLYHYLIPLMFGILNLVALIENAFPKEIRSAVVLMVTILCFLCFIFFSPWAYGIRCPDCKDTRMWTERWLHGPPKTVHTYGVEIFNTTEKYRTLPL